jgi:RHS repeat-associated protein
MVSVIMENGNGCDNLDGIECKDGKPDQFLHSEGSVRMDKDGQFKYSFVLRDHLGNTRVTFSDLNNDDEINEKEEIIQINNYYAFGLNMEGNWNGANGANKYQYNGKEWNDFGLGWNDYGARFYDPAMARWQTVDPLSEKMRRHSPYNYCFNNPVRFIDPDGMAPLTDYYNLNGKLVKHVEDGKSDRLIVLTESKKESKVDKAIAENAVVAVPSKDALKAMDEVYAKTEKTGNEHGVVVATDGTTSSIKEGTPTSVKVATNYEELANIGKTSSYDVHSHPNVKDASGNIIEVGSPDPSMGAGKDTGSYGKDGPNDRPSVVLGYKVENVTTQTLEGTSKTAQYVTKMVGFYNATGQVGKPVNYQDFKKAAEKISKIE